MTHKIADGRAALIALVVIGLITILAVGAISVSANPSGMVSIGDSQISEDLPDDHVGLNASQLEGSVFASDHASSMEIVVTTPDRAGEYLDDSSGNVVSSSDSAIVISDDSNNGSRDIAIRSDIIEETVGHEPQTVHGVHSSGSEWSSAIDYQDDYAIFGIDRFSSNTITFGGSVVVQAESATDGDRYEYEIDGIEDVSDFDIELTGAINERSRTQSGSSEAGTIEDISIEGNMDPIGTQIQLNRITTGDWSREYCTGCNRNDNSFDDYAVTQSLDTGGDGVISVSAEVRVQYDDTDSTREYTSELWVSDGGDPFDGEMLDTDSNEREPGGARIADTHTLSGTTDLLTDDGDVNVGVKLTNSRNVEYLELNELDVETKSEIDMEISTDNETIVADGPGTYDIDYPLGESSLAFSGSGSTDWTLRYDERTQTEDVEIDVNGNTVTHEGVLADNETVSLETDTSWITTGTNTIDVSVADSIDGPDGTVGLDYRHAAESRVTIDKTSETWADHYNFSRTWTADREDAFIEIPFGDRFVFFEDLEMRHDHGEWSTIHSSQFEQTGTDLRIDVGDVVAGSTTEIRVKAHKIYVQDGEINVTQPTIEGDTLDTEIEVLDAGDDFGIEVSNTEPAPLSHYVSESSWSSNDYLIVGSDDHQTLMMPSANSGGTATISTIPLSITADAEYRIDLDDPEEPRFSVSEGPSTGSIEVAWHDATSGDDYGLYSFDRDRIVDTDSSSPATFETSGREDTYRIETDGVSAGAVGSAGDTTFAIALLGGISASIAGLFVIGRRYGATGARENSLLLIGGSVIGLVGVEVATSQSLTAEFAWLLGDTIAETISSTTSGASGAIILGTIVLVGMWALNDRTSAEIPTWINGITAVAVSLWMANAIADGALESGLEDVSGAIWVAVGLGGLVLTFLWIRSRSGPDTQLTLNVEGDQ